MTVLTSGPDQTFRAVFSPLGDGNNVRLHLSNRFGSAQVVFTKVRIAKRTQGAAIDQATSVPVTFGCKEGVTIAAGQDVVSDPVSFPVAPFDDVAVSIAASDPGTIPTKHDTARQISYATSPGAGDHADDSDATAFTQAVTLRPFVIGLDVQATVASSVVTLGDSLTDGYQGPPSVYPEDKATIDKNERYPDFLKRRIDAAGLPFFVSNAGMSGNRVREDGLTPSSGPKAVTRIDADVLAQAGVGTVILYEGINDIGQTRGLTSAQLEQSYVDLITRMHAVGLRVLQATLTPAGNDAIPSYSSAAASALRTEVNDWIRTQSPADGIVDFDAAMRDPTDPNVIAAQYDGGDGIHFNAAGYQRLAETVDLNQLSAGR